MASHAAPWAGWLSPALSLTIMSSLPRWPIMAAGSRAPITEHKSPVDCKDETHIA